MYQRPMVLYTRNRSLRCWRARRFLGRAGYRFEVVDTTEDPGALAELSGAARREEVAPPYVFVDGRAVTYSDFPDSLRTGIHRSSPSESYSTRR
jgi:glutaredoxin